jgi:hypothetical protein
LYDISGRMLINSTYDQGTSSVEMELDQEWNGTYILTIKTADEITCSTRVIVQ